MPLLRTIARWVCAWGAGATLLLAHIVSAQPPFLAGDSAPASAWVRFDRNGPTRAAAAGLSDRVTGRRAHVNDPIRVASISKLAVAMGVMRLVEQDRLTLDADVSQKLGWSLRNPAFPDKPITLRQLLSHTAGVRDGIDYILPLDASLEGAMHDPAAWDNGYPPGVYFTYANLNFPIIAAVMEAATGERFDRLMARLVFLPLHIDACFNWTTCSDRAVRHAVILYRADGSIARDELKGRRPPCPGAAARDGGCDVGRYALGQQGAFFSPQGGMRISPRGLARLGQVLMGRRPAFLKPTSVAQMTSPVWRYDGTNGNTENGLFCAYGLAVQMLALPGRPAHCRDDPFGDGIARIGHAGEAYGLRSGLWLDPKTGQGVAFYATAVAEDSHGTRSAFTAAEEAMIDRSR